MPRYYRFAAQPYDYESGWQGFPEPAVKTAPASALGGHGYGRIGRISRAIGGRSLSPYLGAADVDESPAKRFVKAVYSPPVTMASGAAMAYHGYKRTGSGWWALGWSMFGSAMPFLAAPIAVAQGYGKKKARKK